ncbi:MAG: DNA repair protein RadA [Oscillospiraceae bacterium]|jgi:DNA repair protein RadA/Sms|nr:DNA repair protein RadA [Oscillospiraceae bacterium]
MSPKARTIFTCAQCGFEASKWMGKCPGCGGWNTFPEEGAQEIPQSSNSKIIRTAVREGSSRAVPIGQIDLDSEIRYHTGMEEFDRVLGGGIVKGSLILMSGDPGIGKSTILLQICTALGMDMKILYVSGEESGRQIKLRAERLGVESDSLYILTETDIELTIEQMRQLKPDLVIIDSIQTMNFRELNSSTGSVTQVRECTNMIMRCAKMLEIPVFIVGHVNKDGAIAGPKVMEHIVDAVLYFEGDRNTSYRILRAVKNRYGSTNEMGIFEMRDTGLTQVGNPSLMLISGRPHNVSGTCIACVMEGSRPILAEVQGLATATGFGNPRRTATGFDYNRMGMLLAVLEKRAGFYFANMDAYLNVVGGLRLDEPAADLAVALALVSSLKDKPVGDDVIAFGEIGLAGEIRSVTHAEDRIREAFRLGFKRCILPKNNLKSLAKNEYPIELIGVRYIREAVEASQ